MASFKRIGAGNISNLAQWEVWNGSAWVAASALPTTGDVCYANGFNSVIDQNWTVAELRNSVFQSTTASGRFEILSAGIDFEGDRYSNTTAILYISFGNGVSNVLGSAYCISSGNTSIVGQAGGVVNIEYAGRGNGTYQSGTTLSSNGAGFTANFINLEVGGGMVYNCSILVSGTNYNVGHSGLLTWTSGGSIASGIWVSGTFNRIVLTGQISASPFVGGCLGVWVSGGANEVVVGGILQASTLGPAISTHNNTSSSAENPGNFSSSWVTLSDCTLVNTAQFSPIMAKMRVEDSAQVQWLTKSPTANDVYLYTASELTGYPIASDLRVGVTAGPNDEIIGTLSPVNVDTQQLAIDLLTEIANNNTEPLAKRLRNVSTVQTTGAQLAATFS
jgi:hypothetical protein